MIGVDGDGVMAKRPLGRTGLDVTPLCVGGFPLGDCAEIVGYSVPEERALATIRAAFDGPINFLDTSANYCDSETRIGTAIRERGGLPPGFVLATKADRDAETNDFSVILSFSIFGMPSTRTKFCIAFDTSCG